MVTRWEPLIDEASRRFGVPQDIIMSVMRVESGDKPGAISPKGASGLMQIMPDTYTELARKHSLGPDRFDPRNNVMAGTAYLRENYDRSGGNWDDALSMYNAGPARWAASKASGTPLPAETRKYVPAVQAGREQEPDMQFSRPGMTAPTDEQMDPWGGQAFGGGGGLLSNDWLNGTGSLYGQGQTPSQPPGPTLNQPAPPGGTAPPSGSTRIDELIQQLSQAPKRNPLSPLQYQLAGASEALAPLAGIHDRQVGFGEMLGALGGGLSKGGIAGQAAQDKERAGQFDELGALTKVQEYQTKQATSARQLQAANAYADQIQKINPALASALRNNPSLMDEIAKAQAQQQFQKDERTALEKNAVAAGLQPGTPEFFKFIQDHASNGGATINMPPVQKKEDEAYGTDLIKQYTTVREEGTLAQDTLGQLDIASKIPVTTGSTASYFAKAGALAQALGFPREILERMGLNQASDAQAFTAVMNDLVLSKMQTQTGTQTASDADRITSTLASLGNTPEAQNFLLRTAAAMARRKVERLEFYDQYRARKQNETGQGTFDGVGQAWRDHIEKMPLMGINPKSHRTVFFSEFEADFLKNNPDATREEARQEWRTKYGGQ